MASASADDELLTIVRLKLKGLPDFPNIANFIQLLVNLRNAAATFGEGSPPYETVRTTVEDHLQAMKAKGSSTNITAARTTQSKAPLDAGSGQTSTMFGTLAFRPKPS